MKRENFQTTELRQMLDSIIEAYGFHSVTLALLKIIDDRAAKQAQTWQDATLAKHWANCSPEMIALEAKALKEFGE
jgi:hypothetical protein